MSSVYKGHSAVKYTHVSHVKNKKYKTVLVKKKRALSETGLPLL